MADFELLAPGGHQKLVDEVVDRLDLKADIDGYYQQLTAGAALGITGEATDSAAWFQRVSTSDGPATIRSIHGRTLRWNQLADNGNFANGSYHWTARESTLTVADGVATATPTSAGIARGLQSSSTMGVAVVGHKYLISAEFNTNEATNLNISFSGGSPVTVMVPSTGAWHKCGAIWTNSNEGLYVRPYLLTTANVTTSAQLKYRNVQVFDLTTMFGAGNEPSTVAEFEALFPEPYYPYDAGSLLPVNMTGIESAAADESWSQTRSIDVARFFPGGMRGVGDNCDELTEHEAIHRVGEAVIDGNTPIWISASAGTYTRFATGAIPNAGGEVKADRATYTPNLATLDTIPNGISSGGVSNRIYITLTADETTVELASQYLAAHPITIHHPLDTPTTQPIDPPLNLTYRTAAGGTERVMVPTGELSAPPTIVTAQGYTAESLRDAALATIAPVENGLASTNYGVGAYLVHGGQLCRVTTAIATGEAITIGTNVTATTVMAEVIALIAQ